jgi:uncharacterized protein
VPVAKSNMSLGRPLTGAFEYSLSLWIRSLPRARNLVNPRYWRMVRDILHFNKNGLAIAQADQSLSIGGLLAQAGHGRLVPRPVSFAVFRRDLVHAHTEDSGFPGPCDDGFFRNHALLDYEGQHQWYTVQGGS